MALSKHTCAECTTAGYVLAALTSDRQPPSTRDRLVLVACILGSVIVFVDSTVVNVALPAIQRDLGGGLALQQWLVDAYLLTLGSLLLVGGSLGDLFGARRLFLIGIVSFGADVDPLRRGAGRDDVDPRARPAGNRRRAAHSGGARRDRGDLQGRGAWRGDRTWTAWTGIAFVIGPLVGGWLVTHASWRWVFIINVPFAIATAALVAYAVPKGHHEGKRARVDILGGILCAARARRARLRADRGAAARASATRSSWSHCSAGSLVFAAFIAWERRAPQPMLPLRLFRRRNFSFANLETLTVYAGLVDVDVLPRALPAADRRLLGPKSGLALLPITVVMFFLSPRVGRLSMRFGPRLFMGVGPLVAAVSLLPDRPASAGVSRTGGSFCRHWSSSRSGSR